MIAKRAWHDADTVATCDRAADAAMARDPAAIGVFGWQFLDRYGVLGCDNLERGVTAWCFQDHGLMRSMERRWIAPL